MTLDALNERNFCTSLNYPPVPYQDLFLCKELRRPPKTLTTTEACELIGIRIFGDQYKRLKYRSLMGARYYNGPRSDQIRKQQNTIISELKDAIAAGEFRLLAYGICGSTYLITPKDMIERHAHIYWNQDIVDYRVRDSDNIEACVMGVIKQQEFSRWLRLLRKGERQKPGPKHKVDPNTLTEYFVQELLKTWPKRKMAAQYKDDACLAMGVDDIYDQKFYNCFNAALKIVEQELKTKK